jgi:hypothetical protein
VFKDFPSMNLKHPEQNFFDLVLQTMHKTSNVVSAKNKSKPKSISSIKIKFYAWFVIPNQRNFVLDALNSLMENL